MKLKDLNKVIIEGEYLIYDILNDKEIVYDNESRIKYGDREVNEIYPCIDVFPYVVIELK